MIKLGNMRKAADFVIYPPKSDNPNIVTIQSDHRIATIDLTTHKGILSKAIQGGAYFAHLNKFLGATEIEVPQEVIDIIKTQGFSSNVLGV
jgi:hypothetical protein